MPETKTCPACRAEIDAQADICMHCRTKQWTAEKAIWRVVLCLFIIGVAIYGGKVVLPALQEAAEKQQIEEEYRHCITSFRMDAGFGCVEDYKIQMLQVDEHYHQTVSRKETACRDSCTKELGGWDPQGEQECFLKCPAVGRGDMW